MVSTKVDHEDNRNIEWPGGRGGPTRYRMLSSFVPCRIAASAAIGKSPNGSVSLVSTKRVVGDVTLKCA